MSSISTSILRSMGQAGWDLTSACSIPRAQQLASNNDGAAPGENEVGFDSYFRYTFTSRGTYYLGVSNWNNTQYDPRTGTDDTSGGSGAVGSYQLIMQALPDDLDDTLSEATVLEAVSTTPQIVNDCHRHRYRRRYVPLYGECRPARRLRHRHAAQ